MIKITFPDLSVKEFENGVTANQIATSISPSLAKKCFIAKLNDELIDLNSPILHNGKIELITGGTSGYESVLNHSCAHLLAQAIRELYPNAMFGVGPAIEEGFYYDIDLGDVKITEEDLPKIEKKMQTLVAAAEPIVRKEVSKAEALEMFKNDVYKEELINELEDGVVISVYQQGNFCDLCRGPHVANTKWLKNFKLLSVSGAYWRGDAKKAQLQRIYGTCFMNEEELKQHLVDLEERKKRDHRKLGKELELFMFSEYGPGLAFWLPNGYTLRRTLEDFWIKLHKERGYMVINTPIMLNRQLWETSGHWDHYKDDMFPKMEIEGEEFVLRPMNCPHHMMIYSNGIHSYKDLPIRIGEIARDCRFESSGSLKGIERVRSFCQNDAHLFVTHEQIESEFSSVVNLILEVYKELGITNYHFELSLRDKEDKIKYYQDDEMWDNAENTLRKVLDNIGIDYIEKTGEAAFYGPKLDVQVKPAIGNEYTLSTCQLDFCLPMKFNLTYIDKDGSKKTPVVLHRAVFGSLDRFMAYYLEETKGNLPLWLAPVQINIIPVNNQYHLEYANKIFNSLNDKEFRVELDKRDEKLGYKMRESQTRKIPYTLILGQKEVDDNLVSYRKFQSQETTTVTLEEFIDLIKNEIKNKTR